MLWTSKVERHTHIEVKRLSIAWEEEVYTLNITQRYIVCIDKVYTEIEVYHSWMEVDSCTEDTHIITIKWVLANSDSVANSCREPACRA